MDPYTGEIHRAHIQEKYLESIYRTNAWNHIRINTWSLYTGEIHGPHTGEIL